ncbi:MAG: hypothetical protein ACFFDH_14925, partial [Promethearchaeota archaeon]
NKIDMPIRIRWTSKEYFGETLILLALCGMFQLFFIFIGQYVLAMGNHIILILIPIGVWVAIFFASLIIFESYAQVERRRKLKSRFGKKIKKDSTLDKFLKFPLTKPLLIVFIVFNVFFFSTFFISTTFLHNSMAFLTAEILSAITCLLIANLIEKKYGRIQRY